MHAAFRGNYACLKLLIKNGADVDVQDLISLGRSQNHTYVTMTLGQ